MQRFQLRKLARSQADYESFSAKVDKPLTVLAVLWLGVLVIPLVAHLSASTAFAFAVINYCIWGLFVTEYLVKMYLTPKRKWYFTHHLVDLAVVVLPMLRPLRAVKAAALVKTGQAGVVLANALRRSRAIATHRGLHLVLLTILVLVFVAAAMALGFERNAPAASIKNYGDALWWASITITTVGYGDKAPVTAGGKAVAVMLLLLAIGLIGVVTATVASYFVEDKANQDKLELVERLERIEAMLKKLTRPSASSDGSAERE